MNDKLTLNEDFDIPGADEAADVLGYDPDAEPTLEDQGWEYVASKDVYDEDGFRDVYCWYRKDGNNRFFFSSDVDYGDPEYFDWETEGDEAAQEWFDSYGEDEDELTFVDNREEAILNNGDDPGFDEYDKVDEAVEDNLTAKAEIDTPRGTFYAYKGTWKDFENEDDRDDWGFWFDHYTDDNKHFKIMHNHIDNSAIAVLKEGLNESKGGFVEKYRGYSIHDAGDRYVITNENGLNVGETRFGIPVCRGMIDDMIDGKEADRITEAKRTKFPRGFNLGSHDHQNVIVRNPYNYTIQELSINNRAKTFERGNFSIGRADIELKNRQEYEDIVDLLKDQGYTEVKSDYHSLRNKTRKGIREDKQVDRVGKEEAKKAYDNGETVYISYAGKEYYGYSNSMGTSFEDLLDSRYGNSKNLSFMVDHRPLTKDHLLDRIKERRKTVEEGAITDVFSKEEIETLKRNPKHSIIKGKYAAVYYEDEKKEDGTVAEASFILGVKNDDDWDIVEFKNGEDMNEYIRGLEKGSAINEDTVKQGNSWVNKGKEGTHGKFKTKKEANAQRKAMFANGYKESLDDAEKATKEDILEYAKLHGDRSAADLLLLGGYEFFDGTADEYDALLKELEGKADSEKVDESIDNDKVYFSTSQIANGQHPFLFVYDNINDATKKADEIGAKFYSSGDFCEEGDKCQVAWMIERDGKPYPAVLFTGDGKLIGDDDWDDFEQAGIYGGDMIYCPICGRRLEYDEDGDQFCPKCEKSAWTLAQERRKLDKERNNESVEENPDDDIEGTEWYSTDIKEIPYGKNKKRIKNRKLVDIDKEPVRNPVNEDLEDSKENAALIRTALASGSLDRDAFIDYVLTNTPDEMLSGAVNFIGASNFDTEDDLDFLGDGVDVTDSFADDLFIDEDTLEDGSVITLKDYSKGGTTTSQNDGNNTITTVQNDSEPACDDCDDLPDGVDITLVDVDDDKPLEEEKPLQEMGPLAATLLTAVAPVVADKVMDKVLPEEKEDENKVDDEVYGNADDDDVDIKGI